MSALGSLVVKLALEYAEYTKGLNKADQEALKFAQNAQRNFDAATDAFKSFAGEVVAGAASAVAAFLTVGAAVDGLKKSIDAMDEMSKMGAKVGVATDTLQAFSYIAEMSGVSAEALATGFKKLSISMVEASAGSKEAKAKFDEIGVSIVDQNGKLRSANEVLVDVADRFAAMQDGAEKTAMAVDRFGKSGADLIPLLNAGSKAFTEAAEEAEKFGLIVSSGTLKAAEEFNDNLSRLGKIVDGVFNQISAAALPALGALTGALVDSTTSTDSMSQAAQRLNKDGSIAGWAESAGTALAFVMDAGMGVSRTFEGVGKTIGAMAAQAAALARLDFKGAAAVGNAWLQDIDDILNRDLFSTRFKAKLDELKSSIEEASGSGAETGGSKKNSPGGGGTSANKISDYDRLNKSIQERLMLGEKELALGRPLTAIEKEINKLLAEHKDGTVKLTDAQLAKLKADLESIGATEQLLKRRAEALKMSEDLIKVGDKEVQSLTDQVEKQKEQIEVIGLSKVDAEQLAARKLELAAASDEELAANMRNAAYYAGDLHDAYLQYADALEKAAKLKRELASGKREAAEKNAVEEEAKKASAAWQRYYEKIDDWITDGIRDGFNGGKGFVKSFFDSIKVAAARLVLNPIIQPIAAMGASFMAPNAAQAQGVAGGLAQGANLFSAGQTIWAGFSGGMASSIGGLASSAGSLFGSSALSSFGAGMQGSTLAAGLAGPTTAGATGATGLGASFGTAVPWLAGAAVLAAAWKPLFGRKLADSGIEGNFKGDQFTGNSFEFLKGGVFRSDKTKPGELDPARRDAFAKAYGALNNTFDDLAKTVGAGTGALQNFSHFFKISLKDLSAEDAQKKIQAELSHTADLMAIEFADQFRSGRFKSVLAPFMQDIGYVVDEMRIRLGGASGSDGKVAQFVQDIFKLGDVLIENGGYAKQFGEALDFSKLRAALKEGETVFDTFQRLNTVFAATNSVAQTLGKDTQTAFGAVGISSTDARERLISLSGGIDSLAAGTAFFAENFLTEAERMAPIIKHVQETMASLGHASVDTIDELKAVVKGIDLGTESGAKLYAQIMAISPAFLQAAQYTERLTQAANDVSDSVSNLNTELEAIERRDRALAAVDDAFSGLQRAVQAERDAATKAHTDAMDAINGRITTITASISSLSRLSDSLRATVSRMRISSQTGYEQASARSEIMAALAIARAGGVLPDADKLANALDVVSQPNEQLYATFVDFQRQYLRDRNSITELADLTDVQLSVEEKTLQSLEDQRKTAEEAYAKELERLDSIVASAQAQVDALNGINTSVLSVTAALGGFNGAISAAQPIVAAAPPVSQSTTGTVVGTRGVGINAAVEGMYAALAGRASNQIDDEGRAYWSARLAAGESHESVWRSFDSTVKAIKGYASGGDHPGGWRIVGEQGPELELTGPSRIVSNSGTRQIFDTSEIVNAILRLEKRLASVESSSELASKSAKKTADVLTRVTRDGNSLLTEPA